MKRNNIGYVSAIIGLAVLLAGTGVWAYNEHNRANFEASRGTGASHAQTDIAAALDEHGIVPQTTAEASNKPETSTDLAFLIEEEKLAHDVYQTMYEKWGARVFGNIVNSEATHEGMVLAVMQSRALNDPRKAAIGEFTNPDLQKLYNDLVAQGSKSAVEAYKVGVAIEEKDIADIDTILARLDAKDTDVKNVLEDLRQGSENHLRAFTRQTSR